MTEVDNTELIRRAGTGDRTAWDVLVDRHAALVWSIPRQFRLGDSDSADVSQTTWLRLLENLDRLTDPERVGAWLATTARRECLRIVNGRKRSVPVGEEAALDRIDLSQPELDANLLAGERRDRVREAVGHLPGHWQELLWLLVCDPPLSYAEISARLGVPVGSIGPTRGRCVQRLRELLDA